MKSASILWPLLGVIGGFGGALQAGDIFSINFWRGGGGSYDWASYLTLEPNQAAGSGDWNTSGWQNYEAPWAPSSPLAPVTLTSSEGATATLTLNDARNGGPYNWQPPRTTLVGDGNGSMMDGHANSTEDPGDGSNIFDIEVSEIPFAAYDVVIYIGSNSAQFGDGTGRVVLNDGGERAFTLKTGAFDGTFTDMTDADTPGNYLVFAGVTGSSFTCRVWGNGFNHIGPNGIQIAESDQAREPLELTDMVYHEDRDEITLTWKSNPGDYYGIYWSEDLNGFVPGIDPAIPAHPTANRTTFGPFANPSPGAASLFVRLGLPDLKDPTLDRVWGNGTTISLDFSEAMHATAGTDPASYSVVKDGGGPVTVTSAAFHPGPDTIVLTTAAALDLDADYTVTMNGLTDLAGRPLGDSTMAGFRTWDDNPNGVKVFILAGQSNMQGHGRNETGLGGVSGAIGSLRYEVDNDSEHYGHLVDSGDGWIARSDVKVWWRDSDLGNARTVKKGDLLPSFGVDSSRFGPEYGFGWVVGDYYTEPVLLIKTSWGGKSLYGDFRPPSAVAARGGEVGSYYFGMFEYVHDVLDQLGTEFPEWAGSGYEIVGFGWHQGWNDGGDAFPASQYEDNLTDLINDLRAEFGKPELPVSIGNSGLGGWSASGHRLAIINAQLAVGDPVQHPEFAGTVFTAETRDFWRESSESPADQGYHWNQNGESYFLLGDAMGQGMEGLLTP